MSNIKKQFTKLSYKYDIYGQQLTLEDCESNTKPTIIGFIFSVITIAFVLLLLAILIIEFCMRNEPIVINSKMMTDISEIRFKDMPFLLSFDLANNDNVSDTSNTSNSEGSKVIDYVGISHNYQRSQDTKITLKNYHNYFSLSITREDLSYNNEVISKQDFKLKLCDYDFYTVNLTDKNSTINSESNDESYQTWMKNLIELNSKHDYFCFYSDNKDNSTKYNRFYSKSLKGDNNYNTIDYSRYNDKTTIASSLLRIRFNKCLEKNCLKSNKQGNNYIDDYYDSNNIIIKLFFLDSILDTKSSPYPIKFIQKEISYLLNQRIAKYTDISFSKNLLISDFGMLIKNNIDKEYISINEIKENYYVNSNSDNNSLYTILLSASNLINNTSRSYLKIQDLLSKVGGTIVGAHFIINLILISYTKFKFKMFVINSVSEIPITAVSKEFYGSSLKKRLCVVNSNNFAISRINPFNSNCFIGTNNKNNNQFDDVNINSNDYNEFSTDKTISNAVSNLENFIDSSHIKIKCFNKKNNKTNTDIENSANIFANQANNIDKDDSYEILRKAISKTEYKKKRSLSEDGSGSKANNYIIEIINIDEKSINNDSNNKNNNNNHNNRYSIKSRNHTTTNNRARKITFKLSDKIDNKDMDSNCFCDKASNVNSHLKANLINAFELNVNSYNSEISSNSCNKNVIIKDLNSMEYKNKNKEILEKCNGEDNIDNSSLPIIFDKNKMLTFKNNSSLLKSYKENTNNKIENDIKCSCSNRTIQTVKSIKAINKNKQNNNIKENYNNNINSKVIKLNNFINNNKKGNDNENKNDDINSKLNQLKKPNLRINKIEIFNQSKSKFSCSNKTYRTLTNNYFNSKALSKDSKNNNSLVNNLSINKHEDSTFNINANCSKKAILNNLNLINKENYDNKELKSVSLNSTVNIMNSLNNKSDEELIDINNSDFGYVTKLIKDESLQNYNSYLYTIFCFDKEKSKAYKKIELLYAKLVSYSNILYFNKFQLMKKSIED